MVVDIKDRVPTYPNRKKITYEDGTTQYATVEYADEPIEEGTPINRALLMPMQRKQEIARYTNSGTWTVPAGITLVDVYVVGGGGSGSIGYSDCAAGGGGYCKLYRDISVIPEEQITIQIGAGGTVVSGDKYLSGNDGGQSYFMNLSYAADGGKGGLVVRDGGSYNAVGGAGGSGGASSSGLNGEYPRPGGWGGSDGFAYNPAFAGKGGGNVNYMPINPYDGIAYGCGGSCGRTWGTGCWTTNAALGYGGGYGNVDGGTGGGGGAGVSYGTNTATSGAGGSGIVIIYG